MKNQHLPCCRIASIFSSLVLSASLSLNCMELFPIPAMLAPGQGNCLWNGSWCKIEPADQILANKHQDITQRMKLILSVMYRQPTEQPGHPYRGNISTSFFLHYIDSEWDYLSCFTIKKKLCSSAAIGPFCCRTSLFCCGFRCEPPREYQGGR